MRNKYVINIAILFMAFVLSGCNTVLLYKSTEGGGVTQQKWTSDTVIGLGLTKDADMKEKWVFMGKQFDYLLTSGGDEMVKLLQDQNIDRQELSVNKSVGKGGFISEVKFIIDKDKKTFSGDINLQYHIKNDDNKKAIEKYGFACISSTCTLTKHIQGTIHAKNKNQNEASMMTFYHPFTVEFYRIKYTGDHTAVRSVLTPFAVTADIITAPLQLLVIAIIANN